MEESNKIPILKGKVNVSVINSEYEKFFKGVIDYSSGTKITKLPEGIKTIRESAFANCENLYITKLPEGVEKIETNAFSDCSNLALTELPSTLTYLGTQAFWRCVKIDLKELPEQLTDIKSSTFSTCKGLTLKELPAKVTIIGSSAFQSCSSITEMTCKGDIKTINSYAFNLCEKLAKFVLPNVTSVPTLSATSAFTGTAIDKGLGYIYVPDNLVENFKNATNWNYFANKIKSLSEMEK